MRKISHRRQLVEEEKKQHSVRRGRWKDFHYENMPRLQKLFGWFLKVLGLSSAGQRNTLKLDLNEIEFEFENLPEPFDGFRILHITDMHIDGMDELTERILSMIDPLEYDICFLGGDYTFKYEWDENLDHSNLKKIVEKLTAKTRVIGILGNHDSYSIAEILDSIGVEMLINDNTSVEKNGRKIFIAGIDDPHYFQADNLSQAIDGIEGWSFNILLAHSPERIKQAAKHGFDLYLTGHTHGGQICLPGGMQLVRGASVSRKFLKGKWQHRKMLGYTSKGAGSSGLPVRFFCKPEITLITLKQKGSG